MTQQLWSGAPLRQAHVTERLDSPVILMRETLGYCSALICVTQLCRRIRPPRTPMRTIPRLQATRHVEIANTFGSNRAQSALCFASDANASNLTQSRFLQGAQLSSVAEALPSCERYSLSSKTDLKAQRHGCVTWAF